MNKVTPEDFDDYIDNLANKPETLKEHIQKQISLELKTPKDLVIASFLIDYLEPTGWISNDLDQISKETECDINEIEEVLFKLQKLEPAGVFARNLSECLRIQLNEKSLLSNGLNILLDNLDLLAKGEIKHLMKITNFDQDEISKSITLIRSLNPKPGESYSFDETIQNSPDVIVSKGRKGWVVELNKSVTEHLEESLQSLQDSFQPRLDEITNRTRQCESLHMQTERLSKEVRQMEQGLQQN